MSKPIIPIHCVLALTLALAAACGGKSKASQTADGEIVLSTKNIEAALQAVPADAIGIVTISSPRAFWGFLTDFMPMESALATEYQAELKEHFDRHLGVDVRETSSIVVTLHGSEQEPSALVVVYPVSGELKGEADQNGTTIVRLNGDKFVMTLHDKHLIGGPYASVMQALNVLKGEAKSFSSSTPFEKFAGTQLANAYLSISVDTSKLPLPPNPITKDLAFAGFRVNPTGLQATVTGDNEALISLSKQMEGLVAFGLATAKSEKENNKDSFVEGVGAISGYYNLKNMSQMLKPKIEGDAMTIELSMGLGAESTLILVSVVGVLSAVAIPAFMKYMKKSKTAEASQFLKKMSDAARAHYAVNGSFPASVGPTPPKGSCCASGEKCDPDPKAWQHKTWQALDFAMKDPHYYSYEFKSGTDKDGVKNFTASAYGDLDCDGDFSTFFLYGEATANNDVRTSGDVIKQDALE